MPRECRRCASAGGKFPTVALDRATWRRLAAIAGGMTGWVLEADLKNIFGRITIGCFDSSNIEWVPSEEDLAKGRWLSAQQSI